LGHSKIVLGKLVEIAMQPTLAASEQTLAIPNYKIWVIQKEFERSGKSLALMIISFEN
jgi:hypothetical protein